MSNKLQKVKDFIVNAYHQYVDILDGLPTIRFPYDSDSKFLSVLFTSWVIVSSIGFVASLLF